MFKQIRTTSKTFASKPSALMSGHSKRKYLSS
jgi:hypothetical protein